MNERVAGIIFGIALLLLGWVLPKMIDLSKRWTLSIFAVGILLIGATVGSLWIPVGAQTTLPTISGKCIIVGLSQGAQTNNCPTTIINNGPDQLSNTMYQSGEEIGTVDRVERSDDGKTLNLINPRISGASADFAAALEINHYVVDCPIFQELTRRGAASSVGRAMFGSFGCDIIGIIR